MTVHASSAVDDVVHLSDVRYSWDAASPPVVAVDSLRVARGERLMLRGPSGSGKSTLLSLLAGVLKAQSGSVRVLGHELERSPTLRAISSAPITSASFFRCSISSPIYR